MSEANETKRAKRPRKEARGATQPSIEKRLRALSVAGKAEELARKLQEAAENGFLRQDYAARQAREAAQRGQADVFARWLDCVSPPGDKAKEDGGLIDSLWMMSLACAVASGGRMECFEAACARFGEGWTAAAEEALGQFANPAGLEVLLVLSTLRQHAIALKEGAALQKTLQEAQEAQEVQEAQEAQPTTPADESEPQAAAPKNPAKKARVGRL